jgi:hypothetical protein
MMNKKTLVIGASENPIRYSYLAVQKLIAYQYPVIALGLKKGSIGKIEIETEKKSFETKKAITITSYPFIRKELFSIQELRMMNWFPLLNKME